MNTRLSLYLSILIFFSCCNNKEYENFSKSILKNKNISLNKINEIVISNDSTEQIEIGRLRFEFQSNKDNSIFAFYDEIKSRFVLTDSNGKILNYVSKKGRGPGEIVKASGFNFDDENNLVVYDGGQRRIQVFNLEGEIIESSELESTDFSASARDLFVNKNKIYSEVINKEYLGNLKNAWKSKLVGVYNMQGNLIDTLGYYDPTVKEANTYLIFPIIHVDFEKERLLSAQSNSYHIQIFDLNNKEKIAWFGRRTKNFKMSTENISPNLPRQKIKEMSVDVSFPMAIYPYKNYILMAFENLTESFFRTNNFNDKKTYLSIYDYESHINYGEIELPYSLGNINEEKIYLIENDNPDYFKIGVYALQ